MLVNYFQTISRFPLKLKTTTAFFQFTMEFEGTPIVIDVGSRLTKVGLANEPEPTHLFPTIVARPKVS